MKLKTIMMSSMLSVGALGASSAFACMPPGDAGEPAMRCAKPSKHDEGKKAEMMKERLQYRMTLLEKALELKDDQKADWAAFQAAMLPEAGMKQSVRENVQAFGTMTAPERLRAMEDGLAKHQAALAKKREAVEAFYAILDKEQQAVFDQQFMLMGERMKKDLPRDGKLPPREKPAFGPAG